MPPPSLLTSFTDALPFINSCSQDPFEVPPPPTDPTELKKETTSTGPTFDSYLHIFNSNGWLERDRSNLVESSVKPCEAQSDPPPVATPRLTTSSSLFNPALLLSPPRFDSVKDGRSRGRYDKMLPDMNSKLSNLFSRMVQPDTNSLQAGFSMPPLSPIHTTPTKAKPGSVSFNSSELFQKDDSLCFPFSFDNPL